MTPSEFKRKMRQINQHFDRIEDILNSLPEGVQQEILEYHNSESTLQHCTRWGLQASTELFKDAKAFIAKVRENYDI
jgi:hypothetical protein